MTARELIQQLSLVAKNTGGDADVRVIGEHVVGDDEVTVYESDGEVVIELSGV